MSWSYYIYYRVDPARVAAAKARVQHLLDTVAQASGTTGRLLKKRAEPALWMEVYEHVSDEAKFEWELAQAVSELNATEFLQAGTDRHVECFED